MPLSTLLGTVTDFPALLLAGSVVLIGFTFNQAERTTVLETKTLMYAEDIQEIKESQIRVEQHLLGAAHE